MCSFCRASAAAWISLPITLLGLPNRSTASFAPPRDNEDGPSAYDIVDLLKLMLPAYLDEGTTALADVAEIAGVSTRTLQRKLAHVGLSYSDILDTVRYENASRLLARHRLQDHRRRLFLRLHRSGAFQPRLPTNLRRDAASVSRAVARTGLSVFRLAPPTAQLTA